jgi:hypothetical protein
MSTALYAAMEVAHADCVLCSRKVDCHHHAMLFAAIRAEHAAQEAAGLMTGWRPIATAPVDSYEEVLLLVKQRAGIPGKCLVGHHMRGGYCIDDHPPIARGWYFWNGNAFDLAAEPTHWMPLPAMPDAMKGG